MRRLSSNSRCVAAVSSFARSAWKVSSRPPSIFRSAPPLNVSLPEVTTAPFTASSPATFSISASSSSMTPASKTFIERSGMSQVISAIPSPSTS